MSPQVAAQVRALRERSAALKARESDAAATWRDMPIQTRVVLVMLASTATGDARTLAGQSWDQFTPGDQCAIGACARELLRGLAGAGKLR